MKLRDLNHNYLCSVWEFNACNCGAIHSPEWKNKHCDEAFCKECEGQIEFYRKQNDETNLRADLRIAIQLLREGHFDPLCQFKVNELLKKYDQ